MILTVEDLKLYRQPRRRPPPTPTATNQASSCVQHDRRNMSVAIDRTRPCDTCGRIYTPKKSRGRVCSLSCRPRRYGPDHWSWQGGRIITGGGYVGVRVDGGYELEHRVVMARKLGRPLTDDETVHHINAVRTDNRPENLELWTTRHPKGMRGHCSTCTCGA